MVSFYSINHYTATVEERERFFRENKNTTAQAQVLLQTCNRIECYKGDGDISADLVRHLFRVVSGLESGLVGEIAIQGQVKQAYLEASSRYKLPSSLHRLFQTALSVGKKVRSESAISRGAVSHSQIVVETICQHDIPLKNALITLIGVNKLTEDIIRFLKSKGAETIFLANRNREKAIALGEKYGCETYSFDKMKEFLSFTDILVTATAAPHSIVKPQHIALNKEMLILDLAFPRDVDPEIGKFESIRLYNLDDMEQKQQHTFRMREGEIQKAELIIENELIRFFEAQHTAKVYQAAFYSK